MMKRALIALLLMVSMAGLMSMPSASAQDADDPADVEAGREVYASSCSGCHGPDGTGSDSGRALTDIASQEADRTVHITSVSDGKGGMPGFGSRLSEDEIDAVVSFVRLEFAAATAESSDDEAEDEADADDEADDAASDDDAAAADAPAALAETGVESFQLVTVGVALILAGAMFLSARREEDDLIIDEI